MKQCELCGTVHGPRQAHAFGRAFERLQALSSDPVCTGCQAKDVELRRLRDELAALRHTASRVTVTPSRLPSHAGNGVTRKTQAQRAKDYRDRKRSQT